jgi:death on curing protein
MIHWQWVTSEVVYAIHDRQIAEHGGIDGLLDAGLIASALARPQQAVNYGTPDVADLAASYAYGLIKNHGFTDGNKRTGWLVARLFLMEQGYSLKFEVIEALKQVEAVAAGACSEQAFAKWLRDRLIPLKSV